MCVDSFVHDLHQSPHASLPLALAQTLNNASHKSELIPYTGSGCDWNSNTTKCGHNHPGPGQSSSQGSGSEMGMSAFTINATDLVWEFIGNNDSKTHHVLRLTRTYPRRTVH